MLRLRLLAAARQELVEASSQIEAARRGYGEAFLNLFDEKVLLLLEHPNMGPRIEGRVRSLSMLDFPYKIIYAPSGDVLLIIAVAHHRRRPGYWSDRLPAG